MAELKIRGSGLHLVKTSPKRSGLNIVDFGVGPKKEERSASEMTAQEGTAPGKSVESQEMNQNGCEWKESHITEPGEPGRRETRKMPPLWKMPISKPPRPNEPMSHWAVQPPTILCA